MYYIDSSQFTFSSSLKPIISNLGIKKIVSDKSLSVYLKLGTIPSPDTIIKNAYKLMPGEYLKFDVNNWTILDKSFYWKINNFAVEEELFDQNIFNNLFNDAVKKD